VKIRSRILTKLAAWSAVAVFRLLFRTLTIDFRWAAPGINPYKDEGPERFLYSIWHDEMIVPIFAFPHLRMAALVSRHQDGSYLSESLLAVGMKTVRGSTNRGGAAAVRQLINVAQDYHITITPDGPRGPRRELKSGIVFLASHSGRRLIPTSYVCTRCWRIPGSWTDLMIPMPFSKVYGVMGEPIAIPKNLSRDDLERYTQQLQQEMEQLEAEAQRLLHGSAEPALPPANDHPAAA
jgi:lysophospholipid acyltransferase (LPLAT)-like uncharacterized protein